MFNFIRKISIFMLTAVFLMSTCFVIANFSSSKSVQASFDSIYKQEDVVVDTEYILEERFRPHKVSAVGFSGERFLVDDQMTAGHLFSTTIDGAKIVLGNNFGEILGYGKNNEDANKFSIVGMTVPNSKDGATQAQIGWSFKTLDFIITDNANNDNQIVITLSGTTNASSGVYGSGTIDITATYNNTALKSASNVSVINNLWRASFRNKYYNDAGFPFNFEFSKDDAKINFYGLPKQGITSSNYIEDAPVYSFDAGNLQSFEIKNLTGFDSYTVEMQFSDFVDAQYSSYNMEYKANVVLFEMAGQVLSNSADDIVDTAGPIVSQTTKEVVILKETNLSDLLVINDIVDGQIKTIGTTEGNYSVKVDGVSCETGKYTFNEEKDYTLEYTIYDSYKKSTTTITSRNKTIIVKGVRDEKAPILSWHKEYKSSYYLNTVLSINDIDIKDDYDTNPLVTIVAYQKNGDVWGIVNILDNVINLNSVGEYKIKYTVTDFTGNSSSIEDTFNVVDLVLNLSNQIEEDYTTQMYYLPQLTLEEELSYYVEKYDVLDTNFENGERITTRAIMFDGPTTFILKYTIFSGNEENVVKEQVVSVILKEVQNTPSNPEQEPPVNNETPNDSSNGGNANFFTSIPFVVSVTSVMVASVVLNIVLFIKRKKNGKA